MNLAALFSGGKDSAFAIYEAQKAGHKVKCAITILTHSAESHLLHHPNITATSLQAQAMEIPQIMIESDTIDAENEVELIKTALARAKSEYHIQGVLHGGILSEFQKTKFGDAAKGLGLSVVSPLWHKDQREYMEELLRRGFEFVITSVSCAGLDESWLGKKITKQDLDLLARLAQKHGFNLSFEGGEAETFVVNCPLFSHPITITDSKTQWDGYRGRFEIVHSKIQGSAR
jgi:ABC transporter with metal-binding/Fe-S-binding domain ATP-binding protein